MSKVAEILASASYLSEVRKMLFATAQLPSEMPNYWEVVAQFASSTRLQFSKDDVQLLMQNLRFLNEAAFVSDKCLLKELYDTSTTIKKEPMGIVLLSPNRTCLICGAHLCIRKDRPSRVVVYTDTDGTLPATHYRKYCSKYRSGCNFVQHYNFYSRGMLLYSHYIYDNSIFGLFTLTIGKCEHIESFPKVPIYSETQNHS